MGMTLTWMSIGEWATACRCDHAIVILRNQHREPRRFGPSYRSVKRSTEHIRLPDIDIHIHIHKQIHIHMHIDIDIDIELYIYIDTYTYIYTHRHSHTHI